MITIVDALDALDMAARGRQDHTYRDGYYISDSGRCLVGEALSILGVSDLDLQGMAGVTIDALYEQGLPWSQKMTLGAMLVFRAAQRSQDGLLSVDQSWGAALEQAIKIAARVWDIIPDSVVAAAAPTVLETV